MNQRRLKFSLKVALLMIQIYCWFRQPANKERILALCFMIPGIIFLVPSFNFELTLIQSFVFQAMIAYGLLSAFWIYQSHYRVSLVNFIVFFALLVKASSPIPNSSQFTMGNDGIKVMQFNVLTNNYRYESTIKSILEESPDFISFQEVSNEWAAALTYGLSEAYPHFQIIRHRDASQGLAVFSKLPLIELEYHEWSGTANLSGKIQVDDEEVNFLSLHTRSPMTKQKWKIRNAHIESAANFVAEKGGEFLVLGDFNTVPWDQQLKKFKKKTQLRDSRKKLTPTFPAWGPKYVAQIPIDYIFHSKGISCQSLDSIQLTSDHEAVIGQFQIL
jgi:endonuclease/exonuclease/phosphatase (EEP) superfamily protein YafD